MLPVILPVYTVHDVVLDNLSWNGRVTRQRAMLCSVGTDALSGLLSHGMRDIAMPQASFA